MTNLIIGTRGFIGQNLMRNLVESKVDFDIFDLEQTRQKNELDFAPLIAFLNNGHRYDNIIDCVGVKKLTYFNDVIDTGLISSILSQYEQLMDNLQKKSHGRFIYLSSGGSVYGNTNNQSANEDSPLNPISLYGITNTKIEKLLEPFNTLILRASNIFGFKNNNNLRQGFIEASIYRVLTNQSIKIYGDGKTIRDYMYIDEFIDILTKLVQIDLTGIFNIGSGIGKDQNDIIRLLELNFRNIKFQIDYTRFPSYLPTLDYNVLDITKIRNVIDDYPVIDLKLGINKTVEIFRKNLT
jgi:UDP-glucose 4-epimerase